MDSSSPESVQWLAVRLADRYSKLSQVEAVAFAGSQTNQVADTGSDIDLYIYVTEEIPIEVRRELTTSSSTHMDINNQFWEHSDEWLDKASGIKVDLTFRHTRWIEQQLEHSFEHHEASVGYSTCFWHNILTSKTLFDKNGWFTALKNKAQQPYPEALRDNIIAKNYPILRDNLSAYLHQLSYAVRRSDDISINHRIAALLASYFDIIFAVNRLPHPGEARLLQITESRCQELPKSMREQVTGLLKANLGEGNVIDCANALIDSLDELLKNQGLIAD